MYQLVRFNKVCPFLIFAIIGSLISCDDAAEEIIEDGVETGLMYTTTSVSPGDECENGGIIVDIGTDIDLNDTLDVGEVNRRFFVCANSSNQVLVEIEKESSGINCSTGGSKILIGTDINQDSVLHINEVQNISFVCDQDEQFDTSIVYKVIDEQPGANCANGGIKLEVGRDTNANKILDDDEKQGTVFVCNTPENTDQVLVMSWIEPAGENCAVGGTKLLIGVDKNENGFLEFEEVQKLAYTCDEDPDFQGKKFVILTGDINNEQAQIKIDKEGGPNTEFIIVQNTTGLTAVDLSEFSDLTTVRIEYNNDLESVRLENLATIDSIQIIDNSALVEFYSPALKAVYEDIKVSSNLQLAVFNMNSLSEAKVISIDTTALETINFPQLLKANTLRLTYNDKLLEVQVPKLTRLSTLIVEDNPLVTLLEISSLIEVGSGFIRDTKIETLNIGPLTTAYQWHIERNSNLTEIVFPNLIKANLIYIQANDLLNRIQIPEIKVLQAIGINVNHSLTTVDLNALVKADGVSIYNTSSLETVTLPNLTIVNFLEMRYNSILAEVQLPNLETVGGGIVNKLEFQDNPYLSRLNVDSLRSVGELIITGSLLSDLNINLLSSVECMQINDNSLLENIHINALSVIGCDNVQFASNALSGTTVNDMLSILANIEPPLTGKTINLNDQYPAAPPTGQGLVDKETLESNGNTVITD